MSLKNAGFAILAAALAVGGGWGAWKYSDRPGGPAGEGPKAVGVAPAPDDAALIAAQGYCPVMPDTRLGEMGTPFKVMVTGKDGKEEPVFVCCKGCQRKALADPDKTLAKVVELKAAGGAGPK